MNNMDCIRLKNMAFYGYHGNLEAEQELGQRFFVDVSLFLDLTKVGQTDDINDTINYAEVYEQVKEVVEGVPCKLIERVANLVADRIWDQHRGVVGVSVTVRKPQAPVPGVLDYVEVTINRGTVC